MRANGKNGAPLQVAKFSAKFAKGNFAAAFADQGITAGAAKGAKASVPVTVIFGGSVFEKAVAVTHSGKQWQSPKK